MSEQQTTVDFDALRFVRIFTPVHIPKELIEQVRDREYAVDDWYAWQDAICLRQTPEGPQLNPLSYLYVIADEKNKVVGMMWCEVDPLSRVLVLQTFSMDKKYWNRGRAATLAAKKGKELVRELNLAKCVWITNYPKHSQRYGFKRSKGTVMEWDPSEEEEDGSNVYGRQQGSREHLASDEATRVVAERPSVGDTGTGGTGCSAVSG